MLRALVLAARLDFTVDDEVLETITRKADLITGAAPWAEFGWIGRRLRIGAAELEIMERIGRCAATNVDPALGQRDMTVPRDLLRGFGHEDCGVYARVVTGGRVGVGYAATLLD
jgi:uncharacterized protein YcbX